jgi:tRNA wybutosine-synthesizing protein 1
VLKILISKGDLPSVKEEEELVESSSDDEGGGEEESTGTGNKNRKKSTDGGLVDLEDLGNVVKKARTKQKEDREGGPKEMITSELRQALTKQGYKLIGSHSGVKLCRWTKVWDLAYQSERLI